MYGLYCQIGYRVKPLSCSYSSRSSISFGAVRTMQHGQQGQAGGRCQFVRTCSQEQHKDEQKLFKREGQIYQGPLITNIHSMAMAHSIKAHTYEVMNLHQLKSLLLFKNYCIIYIVIILKGVRGQSGFFNWALTERNIQVRLYLKVVLKS